MPDATLPPVIILASRGAQGSFLSALLGGHPELFGAPHLNVLAFEQAYQHQQYCAVPRDSGIHGLLRLLAHLLTGEQTLQSVQTARRWLGVRSEMSALELYAALQDLVSPQRIVDYSPLYALNLATMHRVAEAVPDAKIIHLVANPVRQGQMLARAVWQTVNASLGYWHERGLDHACMDSFEIGDHLVDWSVTPPVFDPQFAWYRTQKAAQALFDDLPAERCLRLSSEDLVQDTTSALKTLLPFLECDTSADVIAGMIANTDTTFTKPGPFDATIGMDFDMLGKSPADIANTPLEDIELDTFKPLEWRGDGDAIQPQLVDIAAGLGYRVAK
ncbi:MAG: sulfotransferase [Roseovarius sp.]